MYICMHVCTADVYACIVLSSGNAHISIGDMHVDTKATLSICKNLHVYVIEGLAVIIPFRYSLTLFFRLQYRITKGAAVYHLHDYQFRAPIFACIDRISGRVLLIHLHSPAAKRAHVGITILLYTCPSCIIFLISSILSLPRSFACHLAGYDEEKWCGKFPLSLPL